jgi:hypothetical protein
MSHTGTRRGTRSCKSLCRNVLGLSVLFEISRLFSKIPDVVAQIETFRRYAPSRNLGTMLLLRCSLLRSSSSRSRAQQPSFHR